MAGQNSEEMLELIWTIMEEEKNDKMERDALLRRSNFSFSEAIMDSLIKNGYIQVKDTNIYFTDKGRAKAQLIIRRHRLAERLLKDVLEVNEDTMDSSACKFEHFLDEEVTASICTLLGHPATCPHGKSIPPGECCKKASKDIRPVVIPLTELYAGDKARVAYIATKYHDRVDRLSNMGLIPGVQIHLHQRQPSYIIQVGETQIAIDSAIARDIYVRLLPKTK